MPKQSSNQPAKPSAATDSRKPLLSWESKEFTEYERSKKWHFIVTVLGIVLTAGALVLQEWTAAAVFALATLVVLTWADRKPRTFTFSISKLGIGVGETFYPYNELRSFWVYYKPPVQRLYVQPTNRFKQLIKADLHDVDPLQVQDLLKEHLPQETKGTEELADKFSRWIRL